MSDENPWHAVKIFDMLVSNWIAMNGIQEGEFVLFTPSVSERLKCLAHVLDEHNLHHPGEIESLITRLVAHHRAVTAAAQECQVALEEVLKVVEHAGVYIVTRPAVVVPDKPSYFRTLIKKIQEDAKAEASGE